MKLASLSFFRSSLPFFACAVLTVRGEADRPVTLAPVDVSASRPAAPRPDLAAPLSAELDANEIAATVNALDPEDTLKYLPSVFLRKRNYGDQQAVMATRVWGVSSSARSLIFVDGLPLSALIANNNTLGGPRWGLVAAGDIARIELLHGPFSAGYAGNSMGAVVAITTREPERSTATIAQTMAWQHFSQYGTREDFFTHQTEASAFVRRGRLTLGLDGLFQDSRSQPLSYVTGATFPAGTSGGYAGANKLGAPAQVVGAGGLLRTRAGSARLKAAYELTPWLRAAAVFGCWDSRTASEVETYLVNAQGQPTYAGLAGFASGTSDADQQHSLQGLTLRTETKGAWDFEAGFSRYHFDRDRTRSPLTASALGATTLGFAAAGRIADLTGTGWSTADLKGTWRTDGPARGHVVTFGLHDDRYRLLNPTYATADWARSAAPGAVTSEGDGRTRTQAAWVQDSWQLTSAVTLVAGLRGEDWRAHDGYNANGNVSVRQPDLRRSDWSPKARLIVEPTRGWSVTASVGQAYRYATAAELYQLVSTGTTYTAPNPNLKPDDVLATELMIEHTFDAGRVRLALFQDDVHDAIISQFLPLVMGSPTLYSYLANVDHIRARGAELQWERRDLFVRGLQFSGSITYVDARTLALSGAASATAPVGAAAGRRLPNIPDWRATLLLSYRPSERWTCTLGGRYSGRLYTTLDNADVNFNTFGGFAPWFVADLHVLCQLDARWSVSGGMDNLLNREYFLFHPFPRRTVVARLKYEF